MNNEIKEMLMSKKFGDGQNYQLTTELTINEWSKILDYITNLQEQLRISQTNEKTYRLEMEDITKRLGLDEHTLFDEVKEYATNLQEENERLKNEPLTNKLGRIDSVVANIYRNNKEQEDYKSRVDKATNKIQYIIDYGFDYDSLNTVESLKGLIDMLVDYARQSKNILNGGDDNE